MLQPMQADDAVEGDSDRFKGLAALIDRWCHLLSVTALVVLIAVVGAEVILRSVFRASFGFADEIAGYLLVALCFIGLSVTYSNNGFHRIELIRAERMHDSMKLFADLIALIFAGVLVWQFARVEMQAIRLNSISPTVLRTPQWIPMMPMIIGAVLFFTRILLSLVKSLRQVLPLGSSR